MRVPARVLASDARPATYSRVAKSLVFMRVPATSQGFSQEGRLWTLPIQESKSIRNILWPKYPRDSSERAQDEGGQA